MKREWTVPAIDERGNDNHEAVYAAVGELATILLRLGGVGGIAPHRIEMSDGSFIVDQVHFKYDSYAPGLNRRAPEPAAEPEPVVEPEPTEETDHAESESEVHA